MGWERLFMDESQQRKMRLEQYMRSDEKKCLDKHLSSYERARLEKHLLSCDDRAFGAAH
jgi:primosomal protein N''